MAAFSALGLGCLSFSDYYGAAEAVGVVAARDLIDHAVALGVTLLDNDKARCMDEAKRPSSRCERSSKRIGHRHQVRHTAR